MFRIFLFFFLFSNFIFSQENLTHWNVSYAYGSIIKHKLNMDQMVTAHPYLYQLSWSKTSDTISKWKKHFNYPDVGITLSYQNFGNDILGKNFGISYFTEHYLLNRNSKHKLNMEIGLGYSYFDKHFDFENNNKNTSISSSFTFNQYLKIKYISPIFLNYFKLNTGIAFTHFSNASLFNPNNGVNSVFAHFGLQYQNKIDEKFYPNKLKSEKIENTKIKLVSFFNIGWHESYPGLGTKPVGTLGIIGTKKIKKLAQIFSGLEFFYSLDAKEMAQFVVITGYSENNEIKDFKQIGLLIGYEQFFNKLSFDTGLGYYLYDPSKFNVPFYEKINVKYHFKNERFTAGLGLKIHKFKADHAYFSFQYQISK